MNWPGSGFTTIINSASNGAAAGIPGAIITENNLDIMTEDSNTLVIEDS